MDPKILSYLILTALIGLFSIIGNAFVLLVLFYYRALRSVTNSLLASLSLADCLVGLVGIPCVLTNYLGYPKNFYGCLFMSCVIIILTQISIFSLLIIAVERCFAVRFPLIHRVHFTGRKIYGMIVMAWVFGLVVGCIPMFGWHVPPPDDPDTFVCDFNDVIDMSYMVYFNFFICVLIPLIFMYMTYFYIYHVVRNKLTSLGREQNSYSRVRVGKISRESKATRRIFIVLVIFTACWLPIHIANCVNLFAQRTNLVVMAVTILLSHTNSAINPFIYSMNNRKFNVAFRRLFGFKTSVVGRPTEEEPSVHVSDEGRI